MAKCLNLMSEEFENIPNPLRKEFKSEPNRRNLKVTIPLFC